MKGILLFCFFSLLSFGLFSQTEEKPAYCNDFPEMYSKAGGSKSAARSKLPKFGTECVTEYKIQVAILQNSHPGDFPFHKSLIARYRPCEQVWVIESRKSYKDKKEAEKAKKDLRNLGYNGAYITTLLGYE